MRSLAVALSVFFVACGVRTDLDIGAREAGAPGSCSAKALPGYAPPPFVPARAPATACGASLAQQYWSSCFDATTFSASGCATIRASSCGACLESKITDPAWGPILRIAGDLPLLDTAACVHRRGDVACATALERVLQCELAACADCSIGSEPAPFFACTLAAVASPASCNGLKQKSDATCSSSVANKACSLPTLKDAFFSYAALFCGG